MNVGEYVRFDYHRVTVPIMIGKVTEEHYDEIENYHYYSTDKGLVIAEDNLVKEPSPNIIDLIEPHDLLYIDIDDGYAGGIIVPRIPETQAELDEMIELIKNNAWILKGIVTHEQLEGMEYKIQ